MKRKPEAVTGSWVVDQHGARKKKKPRTRSDWANEARALTKTPKAARKRNG